jgi:hypothetical protein
MDSGPAPSGASRNDESWIASLALAMTAALTDDLRSPWHRICSADTLAGNNARGNRELRLAHQ